jgi:NAD(P)-dependent dehydrogenase (short-subunit alcohol dehydrogenase family)
MNVKGQAAIVAGGASGLGGATAAPLVAAGAKVAIFDLQDELHLNLRLGSFKSR